MKALTERQPYASLIAAGISTLATRPRPVGYRGRVAIHAAKEKAHPNDPGWTPLLEPNSVRIAFPYRPLPLGAVVASAVITDCVPIIDGDADQDDNVPYPRVESCLMADFPDGWLDLWHPEMGDPIDPRRSGLSVPEQAPYGDFSPGRWALLLDDIAPTTDRCPWCWGGVLLDRGDSRPYPCPLCHEKHTCDPVPARGRSGLWEWTP